MQLSLNVLIVGKKTTFNCFPNLECICSTRAENECSFGLLLSQTCIWVATKCLKGDQRNVYFASYRLSCNSERHDSVCLRAMWADRPHCSSVLCIEEESGRQRRSALRASLHLKTAGGSDFSQDYFIAGHFNPKQLPVRACKQAAGDRTLAAQSERTVNVFISVSFSQRSLINLGAESRLDKLRPNLIIIYARHTSALRCAPPVVAALFGGQKKKKKKFVWQWRDNRRELWSHRRQISGHFGGSGGDTFKRRAG